MRLAGLGGPAGVGLLQGRAMRPLLGRAVGWTLAAAAGSAADTLVRASALRGLAGAAVYLGTVASGGRVLGLATGAALSRLTPRS